MGKRVPTWWVGHLHSHRRLLAAVAAGIVAALVLPGDRSAVARTLVGWNVCVWLYLAMIGVLMFRAAEGHLKRLASAQGEGAFVVLGVVVLAAAMSLVAIVFELAAAKSSAGHHAGSHLAFAFITVMGSWLIVPTLFGLNYASLYYGPSPDAGLSFPGAGKTFEPDYTDFLYFALTIAATAQTSDVGVTTRSMRRLVLLQSLLAFAFNTAILAFSVNVAASLI